jgi:hypothetical protein
METSPKKDRSHFLRSAGIAGIAIAAALLMSFNIFDLPGHIIDMLSQSTQAEIRPQWDKVRAKMFQNGMPWPAVIVLFGTFYFLMHRKFKEAWKEKTDADIGKEEADRAKDSQIASLKSQIATWEEKHPKLTITFRDNDSEFFRGGWYFLILTHDSSGSTVHEAGASIIDIRKITKDGDEAVTPIGTTDGRPFPWILGTTEKDLVPLPESPAQTVQNPRSNLNPGDRRPILIATYVPDKPAIRLGGFGWTGGLYLDIYAAYRIRVRATGLNARPAEIRLAIGMSGGGKLICEIDKSSPGHLGSSVSQADKATHIL